MGITNTTGLSVGDIVEIASASPGWEDYVGIQAQVITIRNNEYYPIKLGLFNGEQFEAKAEELKLV